MTRKTMDAGMTRPLGAQISHMLKDRGVDVIFGIPGVHNQEMYRGIEEAGITHVLARHEQGAGVYGPMAMPAPPERPVSPM